MLLSEKSSTKDEKLLSRPAGKAALGTMAHGVGWYIDPKLT